MTETPVPALPVGSCDCHMHIFGPPDRYPAAAVRAYDPTEAGLARYRAIWAGLGVTRMVIVQPSAYGTDNRCTLDAMRAAGDAARGVAVIDDATDDAALDEMQALGVRGVRLNLVSNGIPDATKAGAVLRQAATRVGPRGWHVQIFVPAPLLAALEPVIATLGVPVVVDHMGGAVAALGPEQPGIVALRRLLGAGKAWVKISGANRISGEPVGFHDALPVMQALIAGNPEQVVWGSDWPHIGPHSAGQPREVVYMPHDNAGFLRLLAAAAPDAALRTRILVDNPARLYGFAAV